jgi:hypothetical protein
LILASGYRVGPFLEPMAADLNVDRGAMFAIASVRPAAAGLVGLHVDREPRVLRWATLTR